MSCGKLTTGVTVPQWSSILMLRNLKSPETYFQAAFRVQSPWSIKNPNGDNPNEEEILKPVCFVFDGAPLPAKDATRVSRGGTRDADMMEIQKVGEIQRRCGGGQAIRPKR